MTAANETSERKKTARRTTTAARMNRAVAVALMELLEKIRCAYGENQTERSETALGQIDDQVCALIDYADAWEVMYEDLSKRERAEYRKLHRHLRLARKSRR